MGLGSGMPARVIRRRGSSTRNSGARARQMRRWRSAKSAAVCADSGGMSAILNRSIDNLFYISDSMWGRCEFFEISVCYI